MADGHRAGEQRRRDGFHAQPIETYTVEQWTRVLNVNVNVTGAWLCSREAIPQMRAQGYGKIVSIGATAVSRGVPLGLGPYIAAKLGVVGLTRAAARELGPDGIRVNAIAPGHVPWKEASATFTSDAYLTLIERMKAEQAIPVTMSTEDLCGTLEYLWSPASDAVTGQVINVDNGWVFT